MMTNFEQIKEMTVEELAEFLKDIAVDCAYYAVGGCFGCENPFCDRELAREWLESEAD